ncbi:hypothetical protein BBO99_00001323 [Phytophthora kernoviae]|uniref:Multidrug and toxin extrusion protein n=2 Tax=Phytophthora kernoviae TaxID=325452 RepID=A0A421H049_9STRA|nr:hypothetical protein G195_002310 [Phytophthora kernoviae 00238/432]KAG2529565.1 hypothetical protein JM16_001979 [Phytophthora kernoviae]KAG2530764.1 hypothetical protein JM18_001155 [Phytophthora kernoviae]RLN10263.1 hypothetical protein BBI17_001188 [Phytophthora kernoviae]RLN84385.1 hypothetical protein BBO99_00001323 [Phytophthora kernoviae]
MTRPSQVHDSNERQPLLHAKQKLETYVTVPDSHESQPGLDVYQELRTLLSLVYPVVMTMVLEFLPGFTGIILAGHIKSPFTQQYVDAATLSTMFMNITANSVGLGLASALDTLCSQAYGAQRLGNIGIYFQSGLLVLTVSFGPIVLLNWYSEHFLLYMGQDPDVARLSQSFSRWLVLGIPFVVVYELVRKVLQAQNIMKPLVTMAVIGNAVSIVSGYLLTYHTSMGFAGIPLSRSLGNITLSLLLVPYFFRHPHHLNQWWRGWDLKKACAHVGLFLRLGVPGMLMITMEWSAYELLTLMAGVLPNAVVAVSAHAVQVNVNNLLYMVFAGLAVAANIRVGNCLGANSPKQARLACMVALTLSLGISLMIAVTLFTMRGNIPKLFLGDRESIKQAASVLAVWAPLELLDGQNTVLLGVFRGAGEQKVAATVNAVAYYVFGIPTAAVLGFYFVLGVEGLWLGFGFGIFISAALLYYMILRCWSWETVADNAQKRTEE